MKAQETVYKIVDHLLGKNFYIADPVNVETANDIIYDVICRRYKAFEESPVDKWRMRHKKCKWCMHYNSVGYPFHIKYKCTAKDKIISDDSLPRPFCTVFQLKQEKDEHEL